MKKILFILVSLFAFLAPMGNVNAQIISNKLTAPCPFSTKKAVIQFTNLGAINLVPCDGQKVDITSLTGASSILTSIATANSANVVFSGGGTSGNPLSASVNLPNANATTTGLLTSTDWTTFKNGSITAATANTSANNAISSASTANTTANNALTTANSALQNVKTTNSATITFSGNGTLATPLTANVIPVSSLKTVTAGIPATYQITDADNGKYLQGDVRLGGTLGNSFTVYGFAYAGQISTIRVTAGTFVYLNGTAWSDNTGSQILNLSAGSITFTRVNNAFAGGGWIAQVNGTYTIS